MTRVKICGMRDVEGAIAAAQAGADFLGFVFVERVRRQLSPEHGAQVIERFRRETAGEGPGPALVGLFANQPADFVNAVARKCDLDYVQLCGDEGPEYWQAMEPAVIRQVRVRSADPEALPITLGRVEDVLGAGCVPLLDADEPGQLGGTGRSFDWSIAREVSAGRDVVLAGGLTPETVGDAIRKVRPWGVDVSSGVETDGNKDHDKVRAFVAAARQEDLSLTPREGVA